MNVSRLTLGLVLVGAAALLVVAVAAWFDPRDTAGAWLAAFILVAGVPVGALSLRLIGRLTGGVWFASIEPMLRALSLLIPVTGIAAIAVLAAAPILYPWASVGAHDADVGVYYLNAPLFVLRTVIAFAGWTVLALDLLPSEGPRGQIVAGIGLVFHAVMTTFVAYDWVLALTPGFTSSSFGAETVIAWLLGALALATILSPVAGKKASHDLAGLLVTGVMGVGYMVFFQFLIIWYGDLPDTAKVYLDRSNALGVTLLVAAFVIGLVFPMFAFAFEPVRGSIGRVKIAAVFILIGLALYRGWCVLPLFGPAAAVIAPVALIFMVAALVVAAAWSGMMTEDRASEVGHGG
jgi:hypothetical protein